jgi:hypothetical protein
MDQCSVFSEKRLLSQAARLTRYLGQKEISIHWHQDQDGVEAVPDILLAPFADSLGITQANKTIHAVRKHEWPFFLHEAGHLLWGMEKDEAFLPWEFAVCERLRLPMKVWCAYSEDYQIRWGSGMSGYTTIYDLSQRPREWRKFKKSILEEAKEKGMTLKEG